LPFFVKRVTIIFLKHSNIYFQRMESFKLKMYLLLQE